jgi:hypothetical protein
VTGHFYDICDICDYLSFQWLFVKNEESRIFVTFIDFYWILETFVTILVIILRFSDFLWLFE